MSMPHSLPLKLTTEFSMKIEVKLYVGGKVFSEIVEAVNYQDARDTALARNPKARFIGANASFKDH